MLSTDALNNLIQPFIDRQTYISEYIIQLIAERVKEIGTIPPSDIYKIDNLMRNGADIRKIQKELARITGLQLTDIKNILNTVALDSYMDSKIFYQFRGIDFIPFQDNIELQRIVSAIAKQTQDAYLNLAKAQAFMLRDPAGNLVPTNVSKTYYTVLDKAIQATQQGTVDYHTAIRNTLIQLNDSGLQGVWYNTPSGGIYHQRLDTAVRRNILDGVRAINQGVQDEVGKQFGADGKEITVHANSAPDHEPIQGHQFTNEEFEKLQSEEAFEDTWGNKFAPIRRSIGVWNCRHFTFSIIVGVTSPNYTQEQLNQMIEKNQKGYTAKDGKHYTMYQCTQMQRNYELRIRKAKEGYVMADKSGDEQLKQKYKSEIAEQFKQYKMFSNACGLKVKGEKTQVLGY